MRSNTSKLILGVALAAMCSVAYAGGNGDRNYNNCNGRDSCSEGGDGGGQQEQQQEQHQGQAQGQSQESHNENTNLNVSHSDSDSRAHADADSRAHSDSDSYAHTGDNTNDVDVGVHTGGATSGSSSHAQGGAGGHSSAHATGGAGGDSSSQSQVGDTTATSGDSVSTASNVANNGGNSTGDVTVIDSRSSTYTYEEAAARAATVYAEVCVNGGSAQARAGGINISNQDVVCEHLKMASFMREAYVWELQNGKAVCQEVMAGKGVDGYTHSDTCMSEAALKYYEAYHEHLDEALQAMELYEEAGLMDKIAGALVRPATLIGALIWLL